MGSAAALSYRPAFEIASSGDGLVHVLPRGERSGPPPSAIGGFSVALGDGARRETERARLEREEAVSLAEALGGRFDVVIHRHSDSVGVGDAARAWLASSAADGLVLESGRLTLVGAARPVIEWSFETIDGFRESIAPVIAEAVRSPR